jgi:hypothetical protein
VAHASACCGELQFAVPQSHAPAAELSDEADSGTLKRATRVFFTIEVCPTISAASRRICNLRLVVIIYTMVHSVILD